MKYVDDLSYLAAPNRKYLSWMTSQAIEYDLISKKETHLDYGCGRGSDVKILNEKGYQSVGYDPHYFPQLLTQKADVVTCGYVLNVLSKRCDRLNVIRKCWQLTKSKLIVAVQTSSSLSSNEIRATIHVATNHLATKLAKGIFLIERTAAKVDVLTVEEVLRECDRLNSEGWVAPAGAFIKGYCTGFQGTKSRYSNHPSFGLFPGKRYFRLCHKKPILPGQSGNLVKNVHLGNSRDSDRYSWAEAGILRRNEIMRLKFHCSDFSFLDEFNNCKNWDFLDVNYKPNPDSLGYTDQSKKPYQTRNINPAVPMFS